MRLSEMAKGFEEATIDKNTQDEKTIRMDKQLETAERLRKVRLEAYKSGCKKKQYYDDAVKTEGMQSIVIWIQNPNKPHFSKVQMRVVDNCFATWYRYLKRSR